MKGKYKEPSVKAEIFAKPILKGSLIGLATILIVFVLMSLLLSFGLLPLSVTPVAACIGIALGAFMAGRSSAKKLGKNGLLVGAISGLALFMFFTLIGMAAFKSAPGASTLVRLLIFLAAGSIGGIVGVGNANKRKIV